MLLGEEELGGGTSLSPVVLFGWPEVGECLFPALSWHGAQNQGLTGKESPMEVRTMPASLSPQGHRAAASSSGPWQAHFWEE